jgi:hypothetical protein
MGRITVGAVLGGCDVGVKELAREVFLLYGH